MDEWPALTLEAWDDYGPLAALAVAGVVLAVIAGKWASREDGS